MPVTVRSNRHWRPFCYRNEVPEKVLADQFDYLSEDDGLDGFFRYRGYWYHLSGFQRVGMNALKPWHEYAGDSFFSGVVIEVSRDGESYRVGTYFS